MEHEKGALHEHKKYIVQHASSENAYLMQAALSQSDKQARGKVRRYSYPGLWLPTPPKRPRHEMGMDEKTPGNLCDQSIQTLVHDLFLIPKSVESNIHK